MTIKDLAGNVIKLLALSKTRNPKPEKLEYLKASIVKIYAHISEEEKEKMKNKIVMKIASQIKSTDPVSSFRRRRFIR